VRLRIDPSSDPALLFRCYAQVFAVNMMLSASGSPTPLVQSDDDLWYKDAIIYQLHVKAFADSNGDGVGDFAGLSQGLDYLQELGVTTLWLLPFYPSPGRDDGYDIADYGDINPAFGTMKDFRRFMHEAKRRNLRVITELVVNHTSDEHPWFKRARRSPRGSSARNWYVGFQTADDVHNFSSYVEIELGIPCIDGVFQTRRGTCRVGTFPIGIDADEFADMARQASDHAQVHRLMQSLQGRKLLIGVDRVDYSKGFVNRFRTFDRLLTAYPRLKRRVSLLQIAVPY